MSEDVQLSEESGEASANESDFDNEELNSEEEETETASDEGDEEDD